MNKPYPEYIDLSMFNFPPHIDPKILLNLELGKPVKLEDDLHVRREEFISSTYRKECLSFFLHLSTEDNTPHNTYGPSHIWSDGSSTYSIRGKLHRIGGPASMAFYASGEVDLGFYINGEYFANEIEYWMEVEKLKNGNIY